MNVSTKRNIFLQRMLKKNDDELDGNKRNLDNTKVKADYFSQHGTPNRVKNQSTLSLNESSSTIVWRSPSRPITSKSGEYRNQRNSMPGLTTLKGTTDSEEVPNIEKIRREFEMGFSSPTKKESKEISTRSGRFVKKLVAAFEEKYNKTFCDVKKEAEQYSKGSESSDDGSFEDEATIANMMEESMTMLNDTYVVESLESRLSRYLNSYIATSSFRGEESPSESEGSVDLGKSSFTMDEELRSPMKNTSPNKKKSRPKSETIITRSIEEEEESMQSTRNLVRRDSSLRRERQPKIVGAYLKKPVEIEDTSIDWIPITGKKLPRKSSFKRLLSMLTGKKTSLKSSKLYCSELNLQEETTRELFQDSGYDEKSGSSSSLVSLVSVSEILLQQKTENLATPEDDRRVNNMATFQKVPESHVEHENINSDNDQDYPDDDFSSINDEASDTCSVSSRKILLEEVSRSDLRLSLGPAFPSAAGAKVVCSLGRRSTNKNTKNNWAFLEDIAPLAPPLPKHPFVSLKKKTIDETDDDSHVPSSEIENQIDMSFSDFDKVELRRDPQTWKFPQDDCHYDTPRRYISKSEPGLVSLAKQRNVDNLPIDSVYDVPKPKIPRRPRSSIYDEALSLKRRNANFTTHQPSLANEFYGFSTTQEPHYATIKPRNTRIPLNRNFIRSLDGLDCNNRMYIDCYYYDYNSNGVIV